MADGISSSRSRPLKRARLDAFSRRVAVSQRGLARVLTAARDEGLPHATGRSSLARARREAAETTTSFGKLMQWHNFQTKSGLGVDLTIQAPLPMLSVAAEHSPKFGEYLRNAYDREACTAEHPWHIIIYSDEIVCGNPLAHKQGRKIEAVYWSLQELGPTALADELCWFEAAALRTQLAKGLLGGMSQVLLLILNCFFGATGPDIRRGAMVTAQCKAMMIFASFGSLIADIPALSAVIGCKGASGTKPCPLCKNVVGTRSALAVGNAEFVPITCTDTSRIQLHSDSSVDKVLKYLRRRCAALNQTDFAALTTMHGFNNLPINLFVDNDFGARAVSGLMFDWMHVFMVNGCFNVEAFLLLKKAGCQRFAAYLDHFTVTRSSPKVAYLCSDAKWTSCVAAKHFKCTASEGLTLYPILRHWCLAILIAAGACLAEAHSFVALATVLDLLLASRNGIEVAPQRLHDALLDWLNKHVAAYGVAFMKPKHHYSLHLPSVLRRVLYLCACWVHERHHRVVKRFVRNITNTNGLEAGLCEELCAQKIYELQTSILMATGIENPGIASQRCASRIRTEFGVALDEQVRVGHLARVQHRQLRARDVALAMVDGEVVAGTIELFYSSADHGDRVVFQPWRRVSCDEHGARFRVTDSPKRSIPLQQMLVAVAFMSMGDDRYVLVPLQWRSVMR